MITGNHFNHFSTGRSLNTKTQSQYVLLPSTCSAFGELPVDCGYPSKIKVEALELVSSVHDSLLLLLLLSKIMPRRLFLEGVAPCFFLGVVTFWILFKSCFFTDS